jgi:hypothetical protein
VICMEPAKAKRKTYWGPAMTDSQYAVFHFDVKTMCMRDAEAPLILDGLAQAERYSKDKVAASPGLGCRVYNRDGAIVRTFTNAEVYERFHGQPAAKRNVLVGIACLIAGVAFIGLDVWRGFSLIFGVFLGVRFLWVAAVKLKHFLIQG